MAGHTILEIENQKNNRLGEEKYNNQGCLMKIIKYNNAVDIIIEFQDEYKCKINTTYNSFKNGCVKNPYYPDVYNVGITGNKYPIRINGKNIKEYKVWTQMIRRCFSKKEKERQPVYKEITCCDEWLYFEKFYEWLHSQENFDKWLNGDRWALDKDILIKGNKIYSPETCCLVPQNINCLFNKHNIKRGDLPIGMTRYYKKIQVWCSNPFIKKNKMLGTYSNKEEAFEVYKEYKENIIKQVADIEYKVGNITKECYDAMMSYEVEIDD